MRMNLCKECFCLKNFGVLLLGAAITSCSPSDTGALVRSDKSGAVVLSGSNTIGEELAPRLIAEYKKDHPAAMFQTEFKGTGYGIAAMLGGLSDIAAASRLLTTNEMELARDRNVTCNDYVIGSYSVAVIVNAGNSIGNLTRDQVRDVFTGVIRNWKEVGGPDGPIHLYIRDPISGTHLGFRELAMENKSYGTGMKPLSSYTAIVQAVADDAGGIGYCSIELSTKPNVKGVSIGGIAPTVTTVNQGQYPYARVLHLFTDKAKESPTAHDFVQFVQSPTGQKLLNQLGYIPRS